MILYHRTNDEAYESIKKEGFKDGRGNYLTDHEYSGVWLSDRPLDENEGAYGDVLLKIHINISEGDMAKWEWTEEGKPYREYLIPADILNPRIRSIKIDNSDSVLPYPALVE